jgi:hypothetical protein
MKTKANKMYRSRRVRTYKKRAAKRAKRTTQRSGGPFSLWKKRSNRVVPVGETRIPHRPQGSPRGVYVRHTRRPSLPPQRKLPPIPPELKSMLQVIDDNDYGVLISDAVRSKVAKSIPLNLDELSSFMEVHELAKSTAKLNELATGNVAPLSDAELDAFLKQYQ